MLIIVTHNMAITHIIYCKKIKKLFEKCFQKLMEQDSSKTRLASVKTNRVPKYMLSGQKLYCSYYEYKKAQVRNNESIPHIKQNEK